MEIDDRLRSLLTEIGTEGVCQQMVLWVTERSGMTEHQVRQLIGLQPPLLATVQGAAKRELGK